MSESVVQSQPKFSSSFGTNGISSFCSHTRSDDQGSQPDSIYGPFSTTDLPKMRLDPDSLCTLISRPRPRGLSDEHAPNTSVKPNTYTSAREWAIASQQKPTDSLAKSVDSTAVPNEATAGFSCTPAFLPSKVEQLQQAIDRTSQFSSTTKTDSSTQRTLSSSFSNGDASVTTELDEQLHVRLSQRKQSLDFLTRMASTIEPSAIGEKKFMTMTERIQVPSSDHVAEIVGKNGQRIKHLREQLKVWVKTPSRDELPVFEITGLPEKLVEAKRIILQMSEHFTKVQQERLQRAEPNRVEDRLYVEQDKVGLIVGASGQTIRWVQQLSDTHIATPRKQEAVPGLPPPQTFFTICGTRERVRFAKQLICEYVHLRCQGLWLETELESTPEAARLVQDFHQRRQVEDTQRRGSAPAGVSVATAAVALARLSAGAAGGDADGAADAAAAAAATQSSLTSVKRLWQEGGPPPAVWDSVLFGGMPQPQAQQLQQPPPPLPPTPNVSVPPPPLSLSGLADRRYSVDAHPTARYHQHQQLQQLQQRQLLIQQQQKQQQQQQQEEEEELEAQQLLLGFDPLAKKSQSDDLIFQAAAAASSAGVNGWM